MKTKSQIKEYTAPQFHFVKTAESNKVFFATSGTPGSPSLGSCSLESINKTNGAW